MNKKEIISSTSSKTIVDYEKGVQITKNQEADKQDELNLYDVAHDLKGLIAKISGLNSLLNLKLIGNSTSDLMEFSSMINTVCEQGSKMISNFIFNDKLNQTKNYQQTRTLALLNNLIQEQSLIHQILAKKKKIEFTVVLPNEKIYCYINSEDLKRVIDNLLSNALKFTPKKGNIRIELKVFENNVVIEIADSGIGIPIDLQQELFSPYSKTQRPGTENEPSTGLGLSIVKKIIDMNKGVVALNSDENNGTKVSVKLQRFNPR